MLIFAIEVAVLRTNRCILFFKHIVRDTHYVIVINRQCTYFAEIPIHIITDGRNILDVKSLGFAHFISPFTYKTICWLLW